VLNVQGRGRNVLQIVRGRKILGRNQSLRMIPIRLIMRVTRKSRGAQDSRNDGVEFAPAQSLKKREDRYGTLRNLVRHSSFLLGLYRRRPRPGRPAYSGSC